eukprot:6457663-Amphidinium_carterae.1
MQKSGCHPWSVRDGLHDHGKDLTKWRGPNSRPGATTSAAAQSETTCKAEHQNNEVEKEQNEERHGTKYPWPEAPNKSPSCAHAKRG